MYFTVIGGTIFQSHLIDSALSRNYKVICVDGDNNCYCFMNYPSIVKINISTRDVEKVLCAIKKYTIIGAATCQSDVGVPLVGAIIERYSLNGPNFNVSNSLSNKYSFRQFCKEISITKYASILINPSNTQIDSRSIIFPVIVKPVDSSGSRGVVKVDKYEQLNSALNEAISFSISGDIVIEKLFQGTEYGCQVCVNSSGQISYLFHSDIIFNGIPVAHSLMTDHNPVAISKIELLVNKACLKNIWLNFDLIDTSEDTEIIEVGLRLGATELDKLFEHYTHVSPYDIIIDNTYQFNVDLNEKKMIFGVLFNTLPYPLLIENKSTFLEYLGLNHIEAVLDHSISLIEVFQNGTKRFGAFKCRESVKNLYEILNSALQIYGIKI